MVFISDKNTEKIHSQPMNKKNNMIKYYYRELYAYRIRFINYIRIIIIYQYCYYLQIKDLLCAPRQRKIIIGDHNK